MWPQAVIRPQSQPSHVASRPVQACQACELVLLPSNWSRNVHRSSRRRTLGCSGARRLHMVGPADRPRKFSLKEEPGDYLRYEVHFQARARKAGSPSRSRESEMLSSSRE
jgi:NMD protein affecting ribosome stability and mRNA decay